MRLVIIFLYFFSLNFSLLSQVKLLKIKAKEKETVFLLLNRYNLPKIEYYFNNFHILNVENLNESSELISGKTYFLPVRIFNYNGKSIRTTINVDDYERAKRIQLYNEKLFNNKIKNKDYRKDKILWVPFHELEEEVIISFSERNEKQEAEKEKGEITFINGTFPIFGKDYEKVDFIDNDLKNCVYYVLAGHGGPDPGAIGNCNGHQICEDEYAYDFSLRIAYKLLGHGAKVYLITRDDNDGIRSDAYLKCDKDEYCWRNKKIPINPSKRLHQRAVSINELFQKHKKEKVKHQRLVILHVDSSSEKNRIDIFFYYHSKSASSKKLAKVLHKTIKSKYKRYQPKRKYKGKTIERDGLYMLYTTAPTSVYVELANIRNPSDQLRLIKPENRQAVADWITEGLIKEIKLNE
ncbi:MAG: hypothetical protein B6I24_04495 [Bacteroidetes bacterium 4572_128]|nr:MAG: hypothetical protein B6I24_04495 [Bacteroidetes bacterium 4572_128]